MKVCVFGLWHLGTVTAACLASLGHDVSGLDFDDSVVSNLARGKAPLFEPGLDKLLLDSIDRGCLSFSTDAGVSLRDVDLVWVTFDTPVDENDVADSNYVVEKVKKILPQIPSDVLVLISSQLPVGSIKRLENLSKQICRSKNHRFACSPENLRLGQAIEVFLNPDRVVIGIRDEVDKCLLDEIFAPLSQNLLWMSVESAEMVKHALNSFLATSVVFANEIATICEVVGADALDVADALKYDVRIGQRAYIVPGLAFAGGTLARDINFLSNVNIADGAPSLFFQAVNSSNNEHKNWIKRQLELKFTSLMDVKVMIWGLAYKPGTDTLRRSLSVELCEWLFDQDCFVFIHDPEVRELPEEWNQCQFKFVDDPIKPLSEVDALILGTQWPQYLKIEVDSDCVNQGLVVLDPGRYLGDSKFGSMVKYVSVGKPGR